MAVEWNMNKVERKENIRVHIINHNSTIKYLNPEVRS